MLRSLHSRLIPAAVLGLLCLMSLACWSSDTLIIPATATIEATPVPPTPDFSSKYAIGESVTVVTAGIAPLYITERPEPPTRGNRVANAACYAGSTVQVEAVQRVDNVTYYQITCNNLPGWVSEELLGGGS
ncbi:MAG: hypothetical protein R3E39_32075 [Anaerolineae bacterium]